MTLYHLDRYGSIPHDGKIDFLPIESIPQDLINSDFLKYFDFKISSHGWNHLNNKVPIIESRVLDNNSQVILLDSFLSQKGTVDARIIEFTFELVRRLYFSSHPSRYTSLFSVKSVMDFNNWQELYNINKFPNMRIYSINSPDFSQPYDSSFLQGGIITGNNNDGFYMGCLPYATFDNAYKYWSGWSSANPRWEYLIPLPVDSYSLVEEHLSPL